MTTITIDRQITCLRKLRGLTQEDLAQKLGVTNQSVSKWESGACCPDIQLLPEIATCFGVSVDELLGYQAAHTWTDVSLQIRDLFEASPAEEAFTIAYRLSSLLHEGACTKGYKEKVPWNTTKPASSGGLSRERYDNWGFSACSAADGVTVHRGNAVFLADNQLAQPISQSQILNVQALLASLGDKNVLSVLFRLYELTVKEFTTFLTLEAIIAKCRLPAATVLAALDQLPVQIKEDPDGKVLYRLEDSAMHLPPILSLLSIR